MKDLPEGFYTALGTPLDRRGNILIDSLECQVRQQINAGCMGLLVLGSMGILASVKMEDCFHAVAAVVDANQGNSHLFVGVMDNSIERVLERINALEGFPLSGVLVSAPYYFATREESSLRLFTSVADRSPFPVYINDLPGVTQTSLSFELVKKASKHPNIDGVKTNNLALARKITYYRETRIDFQVLFSGLDLFDAANALGICRNLDGVFACCPKTTKKTFQSFAQGNLAGGSPYLSSIILLRDTMLKYGLFSSFSAAMNLIGCSGNHAPDYEGTASPDVIDIMARLLSDMGEL